MTFLLPTLGTWASFYMRMDAHVDADSNDRSSKTEWQDLTIIVITIITNCAWPLSAILFCKMWLIFSFPKNSPRVKIY